MQQSAAPPSGSASRTKCSRREGRGHHCLTLAPTLSASVLGVAAVDEAEEADADVDDVAEKLA